MDLNGKNILVLGLGESGLAMARWCLRRGARVRVADSRAEPPHLGALRSQAPMAEFMHGYFDDRFDKAMLAGIDLVALSPGLSGGLMPVLHARANGVHVVGEIELFAWALDDLGLRDTSRVLAITGTNGKTTTTALTTHLCNAAGRSAIAAGNISPAALDALMDAQDAGSYPQVWVLELSSFQLETLDSLDADGATVLNISDDHLDRYDGLDDYALAKSRVFFGRGTQVLNRDDRRVKRMAIDGRRLITFGLDAPATEVNFGLRDNHGQPWIVRGDEFLLPISDLPIPGLHNAANAMAALALCAAIDLAPVSLLPGLRNFKGLAHRVEKVVERGGVTWYDDSKGTNVGATLAAINGLGPILSARRAEQANRLPPTGREVGREGSEVGTAEDQNNPKIVLILGGDGKGQDFTPLCDAVAAHVRAVLLIGRDALKIADALIGSNVPMTLAVDMDEAVMRCAELAQPGDVVLLSPACASLDMYRNYAHRAEAFVAAIQRLEAKP